MLVMTVKWSTCHVKLRAHIHRAHDVTVWERSLKKIVAARIDQAGVSIFSFCPLDNNRTLKTFSFVHYRYLLINIYAPYKKWDLAPISLLDFFCETCQISLSLLGECNSIINCTSRTKSRYILNNYIDSLVSFDLWDASLWNKRVLVGLLHT